MTNPLDAHLQTFRTAKDAIKVARRVLDDRKNPISNTSFYNLTPREVHELLDDAEARIEELLAFALFAAFERLLRDHLSTSLGPVKGSSTKPGELANNLHRFLADGVDNWRIDRVIDLFQPPVTDPDIGNAKHVRTYRHHVAHGAAPPTAIPPQTVYTQLTGFLKAAEIVE